MKSRILSIAFPSHHWLKKTAPIIAADPTSNMAGEPLYMCESPTLG